jgi:hypothetical protein
MCKTDRQWRDTLPMMFMLYTVPVPCRLEAALAHTFTYCYVTAITLLSERGVSSDRGAVLLRSACKEPESYHGETTFHF